MLTEVAQSDVMTQSTTSIPLLSETLFDASLQRAAYTQSLKSLKEAAWKEIRGSRSLIQAKDEAWRFSPFKMEWLESITAVQERQSLSWQLLQKDQALSVDTATVSHSIQTPEGVEICSLRDASNAYPEQVHRLLEAHQSRLGGQGFLNLNHAFLSEGVFIRIHPGVTLSEPILIRCQNPESGKLLAGKVVISLGRHSQALIVEQLGASNDDQASGMSLLSHFTELEDGAQLKHISVQDWSKQTLAFQLQQAQLGADAQLNRFQLQSGGRYQRFENELHLNGRGANAVSQVLNALRDNQVYDQRSFQYHSDAHAYSQLLYKNALWDKSTSIFSGMIHVTKAAQHTDAYQTNRNILLNPLAQSHTLPGLEIEANQVRCSHGATSSPVDTAMRYYLESRGIPRKDAEALIVRGFFESTLQEQPEQVQDFLRESMRSIL